MTIREFAQLCGCNPQTLRYYDHVELLKPIKVDPWSGYRFYEEEQALAFVKIKNLQKAGFSIDEIKGLVNQDNRAIFQAFEGKIAEAEEKLKEIRTLQKSYQTEMKDIQEKIREVREKITQAMEKYDPTDEFGINAEEYAAIIDIVNQAFENLEQDVPKDIGYNEYSDESAPEEESEYLDLLNNPDFELIYEKHAWTRVKDFFDECADLQDGTEYALVFRVDQTKKAYDQAFGNTILGILLARNPGKRRSLSCTIEESEDGENHFWMLRKI